MAAFEPRFPSWLPVVSFHPPRPTITLVFSRPPFRGRRLESCVVVLHIYYDGACPDECAEAKARTFAAWRLARIRRGQDRALASDAQEPYPTRELLPAGRSRSPVMQCILPYLLAMGASVGSSSGAKSETASPTISDDLWRQLRALVLAVGFDERDNLAGGRGVAKNRR
jgi:hypothetical protein